MVYHFVQNFVKNDAVKRFFLFTIRGFRYLTVGKNRVSHPLNAIIAFKNGTLNGNSFVFVNALITFQRRYLLLKCGNKVFDYRRVNYAVFGRDYDIEIRVTRV